MTDIQRAMICDRAAQERGEPSAATVITDLLTRAEAAEAMVTSVKMVNKSLSEALKNAEARAEKAERERDAAVQEWQGFCIKWDGKQYLSDGTLDDRCCTCRDNQKCNWNWEWRGMKEE